MLHFSNLDSNPKQLNEEGLKEIFKYAGDGVIFFNKNGIITDCNSSFQVISGFSKNEILQSTLSELLNIAEHEIQKIITKLSKGEYIEIKDQSYYFKEEKKIFNGCLFPLFDKENFTGGILTISPIKEGFLYDKKLKEKDTLIDEIEKLSKTGSWEVDLNTNLTNWSREMYEIFEIDPLRMMHHQDFLQFLHPDDLYKTRKIINEAHEREVESDFEYRIITLNNRLKYISGKVKSKVDEKGNVQKLIGYCQDISSKKELEKMITGVFKSSMEGIALLKSIKKDSGEIVDFEIVSTNKFAENFLGKNIADLENRRLSEEYPGTIETGIMDLLKKTVLTGEPQKKELFYNHEGFANWLRILTAKLDDSCVVTFQDYTNLMNSIQRAKQMQSFLFLSQETANVGSFELDPENGNLSKYSPQFLKIMGLNEDESLTIETLKQKIISSDIKKFEHCINEARYSNQVHETEFEFSQNSQERKNFVLKATGIKASTNKNKVICSIVDVTKIKEKDNALQKANEELVEYSKKLKTINESLELKYSRGIKELKNSEARFKLIAKATNNSMYDWNFETNELWYNEEFIKNFGFSGSELTHGYEFWKNHIHPEERERVVRGLEDAIAKGHESWRDEYRFLKKEGYYTFIMDKGFIILDDQKKPKRMVGAMIEVSDIEKIEEKLRQTQESYRFLAESMPQLVWIADNGGNRIFSNRKWTDYTGQEFDAYNKLGWTHCIHPEDFDNALENWLNTVTTGCEYKSEYRLRNKYGEYRWFLSRANPMKDENGQIIKWIGTSTDIHDEKKILNYLNETQVVLKKLNENLNTKNDDLKRINRELDNFVFSASHDLRSPVRNIESLLELLSNELTGRRNESIDYYFSLMLKSVQNLKRTINDLTEVTKIEEGLDKEEINIREIIEDILLSIHNEVYKSKADIQLDLQVEKIMFSPKNLRSIFYNLISNSIKYRSPERVPVIKIKTRTLPPDKVILYVSDNGAGIKKEDLDKVFKPFKRLHHHAEGSGMGMPIVKRIVDNNNGSIEIESEFNKGTTIKITFRI